MSLAKSFFIGTIAVFGVIGVAALMKKKPAQEERAAEVVQEIKLPEQKAVSAAPKPIPAAVPAPVSSPSKSNDLPEVDRIQQLFALDSSRLPIVETISYTSRVPWLKDRPAWITDYASHYGTSRHFIARSLNRKCDYLTQKISPGDRFNVFRRDKNIRFHALVDLSRCRMLFYSIDQDANERTLLKTYQIGVGRLDSKKPSGSLTPVGKYSLGGKIAVYTPETTGFFQDRKINMIQVFGTRWIPFEKELEGCTEIAKGLGLHGAPWVIDPATGQLTEDRSRIGKYDSDGCIRLAKEDVEEIYAIIASKPTTVEIVKDFHEAKLPGIEKKAACE